MKKFNKYFLIVVIVTIIAGCMEFIKVNHPESASVNSTVEASFELKIHVDPNLCRLDCSVVIGMLAPVSWKIAKNATFTYSSENMSDDPFKDLPMRLATDADVDINGLKWARVMSDKLGTQGNYEPMEWVVFISENKHIWNADDQFTATINVSFKTGNKNIKTNLAYFIGNTEDGVNDDSQYYLMHKQPFLTTGGDNGLIDYTLPKMCYITPKAFTYEDIVAINFDPTIKVDNKESALKDAKEVYLISKAIYDDCKEISVDEISPKTAMIKVDKVWKLYMYPHEYFGISAGSKIKKVSFYLVNKDRTVEVKVPGSGEEFFIPENNI